MTVKAIKVVLTERWQVLNARQRVRDFPAFVVELLTNAADANYRLFKRTDKKHGEIEVIYDYKKRSMVTRDHATGMTPLELEIALTRKGEKPVKDGEEVRGLMAEGLKDCADLGRIKVETIKGNQFCSAELGHKGGMPHMINYDGFDHRMGAKGKNQEVLAATAARRRRLGIHQSGTLVTAKISKDVKILQRKKLADMIRHHFALRDIVRAGSPLTVHLKNAGSSRSTIIAYCPPAMEEVEKIEFEVEGYPGAMATFTVWRCEEPQEIKPDRRLNEFGVLVAGGNAIYEQSFLNVSSSYTNSRQAQYYVGRLQCDYIYTLMQDYIDKKTEAIRNEAEYNNPKNPHLVIDTTRNEGLSRVHPFTKALFAHPTEILTNLMKEDVRKIPKGRLTKEFRAYLEKWKKIGTAILNEMGDFTKDGAGKARIRKKMREHEVATIPIMDEFNLKQGKTFSPTVFLPRSYFAGGKNPKVEIKLTMDTKSKKGADPRYTARFIAIEPEILNDFVPSMYIDEAYQANLSIYAKRASSNPIMVDLVIGGREHSLGLITVIPDHRDLKEPIEPEHKSYTVDRNGTRTIRFLAQIPLVVQTGKELEGYAKTTSGNFSILTPKPILKPIPGSNYAAVTINIKGHTIGRGTLKFKVKRGGTAYQGRVPVEVAEKRPSQFLQKGNLIDFRLLSENSDRTPAYWDGDVLNIFAHHPMIAPSLGPESSGWPNQGSDASRAIFDYLITRALAKRILIKDKAGSYSYQNETDDFLIDQVDGDLNTFMTRIYRRLK